MQVFFLLIVSLHLRTNGFNKNDIKKKIQNFRVEFSFLIPMIQRVSVHPLSLPVNISLKFTTNVYQNRKILVKIQVSIRQKGRSLSYIICRRRQSPVVVGDGCPNLNVKPSLPVFRVLLLAFYLLYRLILRPRQGHDVSLIHPIFHHD